MAIIHHVLSLIWDAIGSTHILFIHVVQKASKIKKDNNIVIRLNHFNGDCPILSNRFLKVIFKYIRIAFHSFLNIIRKYL